VTLLDLNSLTEKEILADITGCSVKRHANTEYGGPGELENVKTAVSCAKLFGIVDGTG